VLFQYGTRSPRIGIEGVIFALILNRFVARSYMWLLVQARFGWPGNKPLDGGQNVEDRPLWSTKRGRKKDLDLDHKSRYLLGIVTCENGRILV
jgi:hypothetical protein